MRRRRRKQKTPEQQRRRANRRQRFFHAVGRILFIGILVAAAILALTIFFKVNTISVEGAMRYSAEEIVTNMDVREGDNLYLWNKVKVSNALMERLPYLESVQIRRHLPDALVVTVTECTATVAVPSDGGYYYLSEQGKVLEQNAADGGLPLVTGMTLSGLTPGQMVRQALAPFDADVPIYRFDGEVGAEAFGYLNRIFALGKQPLTPLTRLSIHTNFLEFLCVVARHTADNRYESQELSDSITQKVYAVASYIHHHFAQELSLEGLSKKFFISPYYLSHQFRRVTGFSHRLPPMKRRLPLNMLMVRRQWLVQPLQVAAFTWWTKFCSCSGPSRVLRTGGCSRTYSAAP